MTWTHIPHTSCIKPLFVPFVPHGAIWACDTCGKRWMLDRYKDDNGQDLRRWLDLSAIPPTPPSMEPADVGARELVKARSWLDRHLDTVYADLGLERTR